MGARGPLRDPNSRRGQAEAVAVHRINLDDTIAVVGPSAQTRQTQGYHPVCPTGLPQRVAELWQEIVDNLMEAKVPVKQIDMYAISQAARCLAGAERADALMDDPTLDGKGHLAALKLGQQFGKDLVQWLTLIGATPAARARIGIKASPDKPKGTLAKILEQKGRLG